MAFGRVAKVLIGSAAVALFFALLGIGLSTTGVVSMALERVFFVLAWVVAIAGVVVSDALCDKPKKHVVTAGILTALGIGALLVGLDRFVLNVKAAQEAKKEVNAPPVATPSPTLPTTKVTGSDQQPQKRHSQQQQKNSGGTNNQQQQSNSGGVNTQQQSSGSNSPNQSCPGGICIAGDNKGNATVTNYQPPLPEIVISSSSTFAATPQQDRARFDPTQHTHPGYSVDVTVKQFFLNPIFVADCNVPCAFVRLSVIGGGMVVSNSMEFQSIESKDRLAAGVIYAKQMAPGMHVRLEFESLDDRPLTVSNVRPYQP